MDYFIKAKNIVPLCKINAANKDSAIEKFAFDMDTDMNQYFEAIEDKVFYGNRMELLGQIIDVFDDYLSEKGVFLKESIKAMKDDGIDCEENNVVFYGETYDEIESSLKNVLVRWGILNEV